MTGGPETLETLAARAGVRFGTSGVRGLVTDLSPEICRAFTQGFLRASGLTGGAVLIGHDLRPSSPEIARACVTEARTMGFEPVNAGVVPTPALALAAEARRAPAIMVTGSHIPFDRNGLKFYLPQGEISKEDEARIFDSTVLLVHAPTASLPGIDPSVLAAYATRYTAAFGDGSLAGLRLGIYEHSSAARDVLHVILRALGAETVSLGRSDAFVPIDTEAVREEDRALGRAWARQHGLDAILTTDGDADRPLIADEGGEWLRGDVLGILCARELGARTVVTPVSSNTALEMSGLFQTTVRTRIGSPFVIAAMESAAEHPVVGYEANGGFLLGSDITVNGRPLRTLKTRDAVLPMILALTAARARMLKLSELVKELPDRHTFSDRLQDVDVTACRAFLARLASEPEAFSSLGKVVLPPVVAVDLTDGVRATLQSGEILHLRLSGNAPELRCYTEASSLPRAEALCADCLQSISGMTKGQKVESRS
ncbi:MAG: phosphomannomutase [Aestuariivirga sp.]|nr:phosphomannomutase [Aestuariivirga sp.]